MTVIDKKPKYINSDELMRKVNEVHYLLSSFDNSKDFGLFDHGIKRVVDEMPSADVRENVHGEWQGGASCGLNMYGETIITPITCSECKYEVEEMSNFCPNCGADMRERKESK